MSYTKREWATGNVVGAVDLNRIESGIEDAGSGQVLVVNAVYDSNNHVYTLDKTWQEIYDAYPNVYAYFFEDNYSYYKAAITNIGQNDESYYLILLNSEVSYNFYTESTNDYPTTEGQKK